MTSRLYSYSALLAARRLKDPIAAAFLTSWDPKLVLEAARAINDLPIQNALTNLAALIEYADELATFPAGTETAPGPRDGLLRRVVNANYRLGASNNAIALAAFDRLCAIVFIASFCSMALEVSASRLLASSTASVWLVKPEQTSS